MKINIQSSALCACQALLLLTATLTVTHAWPTSLHDQFNPLPDSSKLEPLPGNPREFNVNSNFTDVSLPGINKNGKRVENPNLFEGDLLISPEEIELYYGKQSSKHVSKILN